jgi:hypothetical protein
VLLQRVELGLDKLLLARAAIEERDLRGPEPAVFFAVKHPARPYKSAIRNRFTVRNAKGA